MGMSSTVLPRSAILGQVSRDVLPVPLGSKEPRLWVCCDPPPGLLDLGKNFLHNFTPLQKSLIALLLMRELKTRSSQSKISLQERLFTWLERETAQEKHERKSWKTVS